MGPSATRGSEGRVYPLVVPASCDSNVTYTILKNKLKKYYTSRTLHCCNVWYESVNKHKLLKRLFQNCVDKVGHS